MKTVSIDLKLEKDLHARISRLGVQKARSPHSLLRTAILQYLEREERYEQERKEDMDRWQRYQETGECHGQEEMTLLLESLAREADTLVRN